MIHKKVLNKGFVTLVDMMGDDSRVLDAARVSTGASSKGEDKDRRLINYLMKNRHHTPFEKIVFEWHIRCPIFVARQWMRHRIGSYNEESARYRELEFDVFRPAEWRKQAKDNHQGSSEEKFNNVESAQLDCILEESYRKAENVYHTLLEAGVAREIARTVLPMGTYTEFYWTVNMRALMNFISLRDHPHAQWEIQQYAKAIREIVKETNKTPMSWEAFEQYGG